MSALLAICILVFGLFFCMRLLFGERVYEHVLSKLVYDMIKGLLKLPFTILSLFRGLLKW